MSRKLFAILMALIIAASLVACNGNETSAETTTEATTDEQATNEEGETVGTAAPTEIGDPKDYTYTECDQAVYVNNPDSAVTLRSAEYEAKGSVAHGTELRRIGLSTDEANYWSKVILYICPLKALYLVCAVSENYKRNGHILGTVISVSSVVSSVIGGDDDCVILGKGSYHALDISPAVIHSLHILRSHPAVFMSCLIGICIVEEGEINVIFREELNGLVGYAIVSLVVSELSALIEIGVANVSGAYNVSKLVPGIEHTAAFLSGRECLAQTVDRSYLGHIDVCCGSVS